MVTGAAKGSNWEFVFPISKLLSSEVNILYCCSIHGQNYVRTAFHQFGGDFRVMHFWI